MGAYPSTLGIPLATHQHLTGALTGRAELCPRAQAVGNGLTRWLSGASCVHRATTVTTAHAWVAPAATQMAPRSKTSFFRGRWSFRACEPSCGVVERSDRTIGRARLHPLHEPVHADCRSVTTICSAPYRVVVLTILSDQRPAGFSDNNRINSRGRGKAVGSSECLVRDSR